MGDLSYEEKRVGIVFGFIKQILAIAQKFETKKLVFCWDTRQSYRKMVYPPYKGNRNKDLTEEKREELTDAYRQFEEIQEVVLPMMGFRNIFRQNGYEADDLIAHITTRLPEDTIIVSSDNDLLQLVQDNSLFSVIWYNFKGITGEDEFKQSWHGLHPQKWAMVKAISGCSGDGVEGITGVGDITAAKYVAGILHGKSLEKINSPEGQMIVKRNIPLVALPYVGLKPIRITELVEDNLSYSAFCSVFGQYGFRSLLTDKEVSKWQRVFFDNKD
jgi:5'-3' exonuclease